MIDHVFETRTILCNSLAKQWFGHYVSPASWDDLWLTIGFAGWMTQRFIKKLHGSSEEEYRVRKDMERVCLIDVNQLPLCPVNLAKNIADMPEYQAHNPDEDPSAIRSELIRLKSTLVLVMLEKRMGKGLLQKLANKFAVSSMSGELLTGLSTLAFLKIVKKITGKIEIKEFADQWIFGSGCPVFTVGYNFNRKKMVIELKIRQRSTNAGSFGGTPKFSGPMVVRVQEPGGTFDTEVKIEDYQQQYDIIYHTKYKRIRKKGKKGKKTNMQDLGIEEEEEEEDGEEEDADTKADGDNASPELKIEEPDRITFEWIRLDPDVVWLCYRSFQQEDFMWNSILNRDKELLAQYEAIFALSRIKTLATCSTLTSLMKDTNYFYRLRIEAIFGLINVTR